MRKCDLETDKGMLVAFRETARRHGCTVLPGPQYRMWLTVVIPVDYQEHPVTAFILPKGVRCRMTTSQARLLRQLRASGALVTWLQAPEYLELLIYGVRNRTIYARKNGDGS